MANVLSNKTLEEALEDTEEKILKTISKSGKQGNLSYFAFTATPKQKPIERFGTLDERGKPHPFHLYSMR